MITPRIVYQKLETDGYPRIDQYNILGNPYTTTQPAVDPGERGQVTQFREGIDDEFMLADLKLEFGFGSVGLTSASSYVDRNVVVLRDASQLTGSVTKDLGGTDADARLNSPLYDTTDLQTFSQEIRLASLEEGPFQWVAGVFYQQYDRKYGQNLPTPGYDALTEALIGANSADFNAPPDTPFFSDLSYDFKQFAVFGEATYRFSPSWALTAGLRYYDFSEDRLLTFAGLFADQGYTDQPGSVNSDGFSPRVILSYNVNKNVQFTAQASRGFRLGGINDPLNVGLCSADDLVTYCGHRELGRRERDQLRARHQDALCRWTRHLQCLGVHDQDRGPAGDRRRRHLLIAHRPQRRCRNARRGIRAVSCGPTRTGISGFRPPGSRPKSPSHYLSASGTDGRYPRRQPAPDLARVAGRRLPRLTTGPLVDRLASYLRFTVQYVGSSFTQLGDEEPNFGLISSAPTRGPRARRASSISAAYRASHQHRLRSGAALV